MVARRRRRSPVSPPTLAIATIPALIALLACGPSLALDETPVNAPPANVKAGNAAAPDATARDATATDATPADGTSAATWYIVGGPDGRAGGRRAEAGSQQPRADFGLTFSGLAAHDAITFTSGASSPRAEENGYSFLVSGAYDFATGTLVTPRIIGELGLSYLAAGAAGRLAGSDPTVPLEVAPTARIGFGADFDLGDYWAVSAEYSAMYLGETEGEGRLGESRLDQKFTVGAKVRF
ncbi:MAG TPA: hypothetical protein VIR38_09030 [Thalassobaculum sp.]